MLNQEKTVLMVLLLTTYLFTFVVGADKLCVSSNGRSRKTCRENDRCCDNDFGRASCCSVTDGAVVAIIVGIAVGIILLVSISTCLGIYCAWKYRSNKLSTTGHSTTTTTRRQTAVPQPPVRETRLTPNQATSSHSDNDTNNIEPPPPYPSNDPPPSYSEINI